MQCEMDTMVPVCFVDNDVEVEINQNFKSVLRTFLRLRVD